MAGTYPGKFTRAFTVAGLPFSANATITSTAVTPWEVLVAAAKTGTLTTRSSGTAGTLTMGVSHGILTGDRLDIYWADGSCRGATVGSVSGTSVPFTAATGDALPLVNTAINAQVPTSVPVVLTGDNAQSVAVNCPQGGTVVFAASNNAEITARVQTAADPSYVWVTGQGTNPLAGGAVAKVFISQGYTAAAQTLTGAVQFN
jgi:hypothetical protein